MSTHLNLQGVAVVSLDKRRDNVPQDKVALLPEVKADALKAGARKADDALVAADADLLAARDDALDNNNGRGRVLLADSSSELGKGRDGGHSAARAALSAEW